MMRRSYECLVLLVMFVGFVGIAGCRSAEKAPEKAVAPEPGPEMAELAARAEKAIEEAGDSVGREYANRLRTPPHPAWIKYFKGEGPRPSRGNMKRMADGIEKQIKMINAAKSWPAPGTHRIPKTSSAPKIDGKLDDAAWKNAAVWKKIYPFNESEEGGPDTTWLMTWDDENLYVAYDCADSDVVAEDRDRDGHVYFDDCVEMFILPEFRFHAYWEIVIGPNGSVFDSAQCKQVKKWGCIGDKTQHVKGMKHAQTIQGTLNNTDDTDEGYIVEVSVPFSQLPGYSRCAPEAGDRFHMMLVRLDRVQGEFNTYAFRPLQAWGHNIWNHAIMQLAD